MRELDRARHARERGMLLTTLAAEYSGRMTRVADLAGAMSIRGCPLTREGMQFHLSYLADEGYIAVTAARDTPGFRPDRMTEINADELVFAKIRPLGVRLIDGAAEANAGVMFL